MMGSSDLDGRVAAIVGRDRERAVIDQLLGRARLRQSGSLVIRAEAGMGKTALLRYAADAGPRDARPLGHGRRGGIRPRLLGAAQPRPADHRAAPASARARSARRSRRRSGWRRPVARTASSSLPACSRCSRRPRRTVPSCASSTTRSGSTCRRPDRSCSPRGGLAPKESRSCSPRERASGAGFDAPGLDELVLAGLDSGSAVELLDRGERELAPSVRERLLADAAGNPLALIELPACLSDAQLSGRARMPDAIPLSSRLQLAFRQQIERLPRDHPVGAAAGRRRRRRRAWRSSFAAAAAPHLPEDALDAAERAGLIETDDARLTFRHPLIRSAVYEAATSGERRRAHGALAESCRGDEHADRRLWHLSVATLAADEEIAAAASRRPRSGRRCAAVMPRQRPRSSVRQA